jgi:hypothetical protein
MSLVVRDGIHSGIDLQFPALYREEGEFMVEFTKAYYKFLDERMDRNIPKLRDIDTTLASFLIFFKKKYLADLPLDTVIDTRFIIKHVTDLYKRKGTQESLELLFQLFYNEQIEVFYPSTNILKPSDSVWGGDTYLEMKPVFVVDDYAIQKGDRISGSLSLASAFVDEIIFVNFTGSFTPIAYLSNIVGKFLADDSISVTRSGITSSVGKLIAGSINSSAINQSNRISGQTIGNRLKLVSDKFGIDATATVLAVSDAATGQINFAVEDGGFGYVNPTSLTATNAVGISNQVIIVSQALSPTIRPGDIITCGNGVNISSAAVTSPGKTFAVTPTPITGSAVVIAYTHPLLYIKTLDNTSRTARLNQTVTSGTYVGVKLILAEMLRTIAGLPTDNPDWDIILETIGPNGYAYGDVTRAGLSDYTDVIQMNLYIAGTLTNAAYINQIEQYLLPALGIYKQFNQFPVNPLDTTGQTIGSGNMVATFTINNSANVMTTSTMTTISGYNTSASYQVSDITDSEYVTLITDQIGDYESVLLSSSDYLMSGTGAETINTTLKDAFTPLTVELGAISELKVLSSGTDYENDVFSKIEHSNISKFDKRDVIINFTTTDFLLKAGDIVTQAIQIEDLAAASQVGNVDVTTLGISNTSGNYPSTTTITISSGDTISYTVKGKFLRRDGDDYYFRQLSFYDFVKGGNVNITNNLYVIQNIRYDMNSAPMGANAVVSGLASYQTGQIEKIAIVNSGYRYQDGETVSIVNQEPSNTLNYNKTVATAVVRTLGSGVTEGTWKTTTSFLSEVSKKLHDNYYYQEYSYEVSSIIDPAKYEPLIRDTIGVAGTKIFSSPLINSINDVSPSIDIELQVFNISEENLLDESGVDQIVTDANENLVAVIVTLDSVLSASISASIGT